VVFKAGYKQRRPKMTTVQIVVLVVMGVMVLGLLGVLGKLVLNMIATLDAEAKAKAMITPTSLGTPAPTPTKTPTPTPTVEPGFERYEYPDEGFLINVPEEWMLTDEEGDETGSLDGLDEVHIWVAPEQVYAEEGYVAILAGREYVNQKLKLEEIPEWLAADAGDAEVVVSHKLVILPIGESQKIQLHVDEFYGLMYACPKDKYLYFVWFMYADPELGDRNEITFEKVAQSFRVMGNTVATVTPTPKYAPLSPDCMPGASFVEDVTVPDSTEFAPGETFTKTWAIVSDGCADLPEGTILVFDSGDLMDGPEEVEVPEMPIDATIDVSVVLTAPEEPGTYEAWWQLEAYDGTRFGEKLYLKIVVR
jgi:hypothetical protein